MIVDFFIPGEPKAKERPKFSRNMRTGKVKVYTPKGTSNYEETVRWRYRNEFGLQKFEPDVPLMVIVKVHCYIPRSTSKKKRSLMEDNYLKPTKKPDVDNVLKIILDSLNKVAYDDDKQVVYAAVEKMYGPEPGVNVYICEYEGMISGG